MAHFGDVSRRALDQAGRPQVALLSLSNKAESRLPVDRVSPGASQVMERKGSSLLHLRLEELMEAETLSTIAYSVWFG